MTGENIRLETLDNGLQVALVHCDYFRSTAACLSVYAGSLHEGDDAYGGMHYLEHVVAGQGTEGLPTWQQVRAYRARLANSSAHTWETTMHYDADGNSLDRVLYWMTQQVLHPRISDEGVAAVRGPVLSELQQQYSNLERDAGANHRRVIGGEPYARFRVGDEQSINAMSPPTLRALYARYYLPANMALVICSSASLDEQHDRIRQLLDGVPTREPVEEIPPKSYLPHFNPAGHSVSLEQVNMPNTALTHLGLMYELPSAGSREERMTHAIIKSIFSTAMLNEIRQKLGVAYTQNANLVQFTDRCYGREEQWGYLSFNVKTKGSNAIIALNALHHIITAPLPEELFASCLDRWLQEFEGVKERGPSVMAAHIRKLMNAAKVDHIDLDIPRRFGERLTFADLQEPHRAMVDSRPLVVATSPDAAVLEQIGDWAASHI